MLICSECVEYSWLEQWGATTCWQGGNNKISMSDIKIIGHQIHACWSYWRLHLMCTDTLVNIWHTLCFLKVKTCETFGEQECVSPLCSDVHKLIWVEMCHSTTYGHKLHEVPWMNGQIRTKNHTIAFWAISHHPVETFLVRRCSKGIIAGMAGYKNAFVLLI